MSGQLIVFIVFLILNAIASLIYGFVGYTSASDERKSGVVMRTIVALLMPGVALLFYLCSWLGFKFIFKTDVDLSDVVFSKERERELLNADEEENRKLVPIEEAIEVTDNADLRSLVMNVAQGDFSDSLATISLALNCEDSETAHYAASVLQDALNGFRLETANSFNLIKMHFSSTIDPIKDEAIELMEKMNKVLIQQVFAPVEQKHFVEMYAEIARMLYAEDKEAFSPELFESVCLRTLEIGDFELCEKWCKYSIEQYKEELSTYTCQLKLYFNWGKKEEFFVTLDELKKSSVIIDGETLKLIRTFS